MKHIKSIEQFKAINEQLFAAEIARFNKLMGISVEETGMEEPNLFAAESPVGLGQALVPIARVDVNQMDSYGSTVGVTDKNDSAEIQQPSSGPIGNIVNSAYANLNTSTRKIPGTKGGNLGCAAAVSIIFYRATGYAIAGSGAVTLGTGSLWSHMESESKKSDGVWRKIANWKTESQPGDIILTARGGRPGHVGIVVDGGNIISNSSGGFKGDKKGQVEMNYNLNSWDSVANRNPAQTASFRYVGPYKRNWGPTQQIA
jgi:cell wall-associated NlpC family hydrolase